MRRFVSLLVLSGCYVPYVPPDATDDSGPVADDSGDTEPLPDCAPDGEVTCFGNELTECVAGEWERQEACAEACDPVLGCVACVPERRTCDGDVVMACTADGAGQVAVETCEPPFTCAGGECRDPCDPASLAFSYLGCDFLAVSTSNPVSPVFDNDFAVVIANPAGGSTANVRIERGGALITTRQVAAGETAALPLPMVAQLKGAQQSVVVVDGAYEIHTDVPVAAYQYNPLNFLLSGESSYSNDASLLLPEHTLTGNYMASTWPTFGVGSWTNIIFGVSGEWSFWHPGFVAIAATADGTQVTFTASGKTAGGSPPALSAGQSTTITLDRGDVAQVFSHRPGPSSDLNFCSNQGWTDSRKGSCPPTSFGSQCEVYCSADGADLTGSRIAATAPVAVFAGHMCTFMPFDAWACDHLEEMMFPLETWGSEVFMSAPVHPNGAGVAPTLYRILSASDGVAVTFDPPSVHPGATIDEGDFIELQANTDFLVKANGPVYVTQTLFGQDKNGGTSGDPAMGSGIPTRQTRDTYDFLTPSTYTSNYVNVVAPTGATVVLDGAAIGGWQAIGATGHSVARVPISAGAHHMESQGGERFGITTYGYASYTSYLYPGGLNFSR